MLRLRHVCVPALALLMVAAGGFLGQWSLVGVAGAQSVGGAAALPGDLNLASLRVNALTMLYELDLSAEQLRALRTAAAKMASVKKRTPAKANAGMAAAFRDFQAALLAGKDDDAITKARNHVVELAGDLDLDDAVDPTDAALAGAPAVCGELKASQLAAFLAVHADQVADPVEMILGALESVRDIRADAPAGKLAATDAEVGTLVSATAVDASYLVFGKDSAKAGALETKIAAWLKTNGEMAEKDFDAQAAGREEALKKLIGMVDPIQVLANWLDLRLAELMSNPELPAAIDAMLARPAK